MNLHALFETALGLVPPWKVVGIDFTDAAGGEARGRLTLRLDFPRGSRFACRECGELCPVHDTSEKTWRHLDFFQHVAELQARVPRTNCPEHGVLIVPVPWAREGSGFTLLFEAYVMLMASEMPMRALARSVGEHDTRLWRLVEVHVGEARKQVHMSDVRQLVVDETSRAKRHQYVTLFAEPGEDQARVLYVAEGATHKSFEEFASDLTAHGAHPGKIEDVCMDMSEAFQKGAAQTLPQAAVTFDRFHVMKLANEAVDEVRRQERAQRPELRHTRYAWLANPENITKEQVAHLESLSRLHLKTAKAYQMRVALRDLWSYRSVSWARKFLDQWCRWVTRASRPNGSVSPLEPMRRVARTLRENKRGILNYFRHRLTTAVMEGINSVVQAARSRARGYRNANTFKAMIYLIAGRLTFDLPCLTHSR